LTYLFYTDIFIPLVSFCAALEAALSSPNLFFGVDFCGVAEEEQQDDEEI
jgi:hypothetical protein